MRYLFLFIFFAIQISTAQTAVLDTLVDLGSNKLHFRIFLGNGTPILFESGAGDDAMVWRDILGPIYKITGTTLITYDRAGFGKSGVNPTITSEEGHGILNGIEELEAGLKKLGFDKDIVLVSHSYGGFYTTLFSARNPEKVKYNVRIDANLVGQYTDDILIKISEGPTPPKSDSTLGIYHLVKTYANTVRFLRQIEFPTNVAVIDIVSPIQRHHTDEEWALLRKTHQEFVTAQPNRMGIVAAGSGHYIFKDNPGLVTLAIVKAYSETISDAAQKQHVLSKALDYSIDLQIPDEQPEDYD